MLKTKSKYPASDYKKQRPRRQKPPVSKSSEPLYLDNGGNDGSDGAVFFNNQILNIDANATDLFKDSVEMVTTTITDPKPHPLSQKVHAYGIGVIGLTVISAYVLQRSKMSLRLRRIFSFAYFKASPDIRRHTTAHLRSYRRSELHQIPKNQRQHNFKQIFRR